MNNTSSGEDTRRTTLGKRCQYYENKMDYCYITLLSDSSGYFPANTIADFRTKLVSYTSITAWIFLAIVLHRQETGDYLGC